MSLKFTASLQQKNKKKLQYDKIYIHLSNVRDHLLFLSIFQAMMQINDNNCFIGFYMILESFEMCWSTLNCQVFAALAKNRLHNNSL